MIISHKHRFIYIKTLKTAGTSLEIALSKFCGPDDIITKISRNDEKIRAELGYRGAQNYGPRLSYIIKDLKECTRSGTNLVRFYNHIPAATVRSRVASDVWDNYLKFTTVRHPFDLAVSLYYWKKQYENKTYSFSEFLRRHSDQLYRNTGIVSDDNQFILDDFVRFENFQEDLERIGDKIGLSESLWSVFRHIQAKGGLRNTSDKTSDLISRNEMDVIKYMCAFEFKNYGYD